MSDPTPNAVRSAARTPDQAATIARMAETLADALLARGAATADDLARAGFLPDEIALWHAEAIAEARRDERVAAILSQPEAV